MRVLSSPQLRHSPTEIFSRPYAAPQSSEAKPLPAPVGYLPMLLGCAAMQAMYPHAFPIPHAYNILIREAVGAWLFLRKLIGIRSSAGKKSPSVPNSFIFRKVAVCNNKLFLFRAARQHCPKRPGNKRIAKKCRFSFLSNPVDSCDMNIICNCVSALHRYPSVYPVAFCFVNAFNMSDGRRIENDIG